MEIKEQAVLEPRLVNDIKGQFFIPAYQRGYRWEKEHVLMLLNDIWENGDNNYCLQPVVVKKIDENKYELIDGQQRITSLFLILKFMKQVLPFIELNFSLSYETRLKSEEFLEIIDENLAEDNIDFNHIYIAYKTIESWFNDPETGEKNLKAINLYKYFGERVNVIWYEVSTNVDAIALFTRLNIGKIPLTNAELVKALFLSRDHDDITEEKQLEISTSWDLMEQELQNNDFWSFTTNQPTDNYATRIELIFDLMANKHVEEKEKFFTFFYFTEQLKEVAKVNLWKQIRDYYLIIKAWYENRDIYHKIGFLIAIGKKLQSIIADSKDKTKTEFQNDLNDKIKASLNLTKENILDLSYDNISDNRLIEKVLLLFDVETTRLLKNSSTKYSFDNYKRKNWSLEHIHAQNSEGLNTKDEQQLWLDLHKKSLENIDFKGTKKEKAVHVIQKIEENYNTITKVLFDQIFSDVFELLSENEDRSYMDTISNMALLSIENNAALNNSTFDVKRNKILEMDKNGDYIPICTRRVFLKYYTDSNNQQLNFWGEDDRKAYLEAMIGENGMLMKYLNPTEINA